MYYTQVYILYITEGGEKKEGERIFLILSPLSFTRFSCEFDCSGCIAEIIVEYMQNMKRVHEP